MCHRTRVTEHIIKHVERRGLRGDCVMEGKPSSPIIRFACGEVTAAMPPQAPPCGSGWLPNDAGNGGGAPGGGPGGGPPGSTSPAPPPPPFFLSSASTSCSVVGATVAPMSAAPKTAAGGADAHT